jgi:hypothetical protein
MLQVQENVTEAAKVECQHERLDREYREKEQRERESRRAQTVGELIDVLGQDTTPTNRREVEDTLCQILDRARVFFADNEVCRGALVIAAAAINAAHYDGGFISQWRGEQLTKYLVLLANELQGARGAGYFDLDTRTRLDRITDLLPDSEDDDLWEWPSSETTRYYPFTL